MMANLCQIRLTSITKISPWQIVIATNDFNDFLHPPGKGNYKCSILMFAYYCKFFEPFDLRV